MIESDDSQWFVVPKVNKKASLRIFCFPYAGGSASTYTSWPGLLSDTVEMVFVQPPGRGARLLENGFTQMGSLINSLVAVMSPFLNTPYVIFGHSMGARIGFELIRRFQALTLNTPLHFISSGSPAPNTALKTELMHIATDDDFKNRLRHLNATPEEVLQNNELMDLLMPSLRSDFQLAETYSVQQPSTIRCPITVFRGIDDDWVDEKSADQWRLFTSKGCDTVTFMGGHMFIEQYCPEVVSQVNKIIDDLITPDLLTPDQIESKLIASN